ncbi:MAG TPA: hypothetical protein VMO47_05000 [Rhodothermales bacterium]|nr:hypothetical protein [Rhodothermales bacterium]
MTIRLLATITLITATSMTAFGQVQFGGQLGLAFDNSDLYIGANAVFPSPWELNDQTVQFNPEVNFYFLEDSPVFDQSLMVIALNGLLPLGLEFANTYVGAGVLLSFYKADFETDLIGDDFDDTDVGLNAKLGIDFGKEDSTIIPWVEGGVHIVDGGGLYVQGGARVAL